MRLIQMIGLIRLIVFFDELVRLISCVVGLIGCFMWLIHMVRLVGSIGWFERLVHCGWFMSFGSSCWFNWLGHVVGSRG